MPSEASGNIPSVKYFNKIYGENRWKFATVISLSIGQGEVLTTPLQLANLFACIANKGYWITPHVVRKITDPVTGKDVTHPYERHQTFIDIRHFDPVIEGLHQVLEAGTARGSRVEGISICGKTGTAQNPHGDNHSMFAAFAPKENPKIAIAVIVENGGYGGAFAAPIATLMIEKYLNDTIQSSRVALETKMKEANLLNKYGISVNRSAQLQMEDE